MYWCSKADLRRDMTQKRLYLNLLIVLSPELNQKPFFFLIKYFLTFFRLLSKRIQSVFGAYLSRLLKENKM